MKRQAVERVSVILVLLQFTGAIFFLLELEFPAIDFITQVSCEVSRLAVHPYFRRRRGEAQTRLGAPDLHFEEPSDLERRTFPLLSVSLICAAPAMALLIGRPNLFIMIEGWLATLLRRMGMPLVQIGNTTNYHGQRTAFFIRAEEIVAGFKGETRHLYDFVETLLRESAARQGLNDRSKS